jgi:putative ABC transport system substrate-binding protein
MRRREFVTLLVGAAATWPRAARAQQAERLPTIGYFSPGTPSAYRQWSATFAQRLRELGWVEGRDIAIEYRFTEGRNERIAEIAAELDRRKVDVIFAPGNLTGLAAKQATSTIPIVFAGAGDPVGTGLVASLARPGGNVTGVSSQNLDLDGKRVELLREVVPGLLRLAILANDDVANVANGRLLIGAVQVAARILGLEVAVFDVRRAEDIAPAFEALKGRVDALYVPMDTFSINNQTRINTLALAARLPTVHVFREAVEAGGLMSYGPSVSGHFRRAAEFVDKILRGTKPADIPIEQPTKFELIVNLTTAKAIGLTIPETFLVRADEVIE